MQKECMETTQYLSDPETLIRGLRSKAIRDRLDAIEREREALKILLRAAVSAERKEAEHASR